VIAKAYKLTPTELRILLAIAEIGGVSEVAEAFGVSETTIKFHLKNLFDKTGARRQTDLVRLLAGFATPLSG
jgi:DNA-binding CsgD family transcriptional regulator